jgi:hypothetical protein
MAAAGREGWAITGSAGSLNTSRRLLLAIVAGLKYSNKEELRGEQKLR